MSMLKALLGNVILKYDVKTENGVRPRNFEFHLSELPDMKARLLFRRRVQAEESTG